MILGLKDKHLVFLFVLLIVVFFCCCLFALNGRNNSISVVLFLRVFWEASLLEKHLLSFTEAENQFVCVP